LEQEAIMNENRSHQKIKVPIRMYVFFVLYILLFPAVIFLVGGTLRWPMGWWYYGLSVAATVVSRLIVARVNPDQLTERGTSMSAENVKSWDRTLSKLVGLVIPVVVLAVTGLDHRWSWSPVFPSWASPFGIILLTFGYTLATWAFVVNRFFSGVVRIQHDRGHYVISAGPYGFVRHPGYLGGLISIIATPILLGSLWGLVPVAVYCVVLIARTALEDRTLQEELPGYKEYSQGTRYRLLPGLW
jgi:protein-S-isoprenylcysteine O-methyltransferase Ste14